MNKEANLEIYKSKVILYVGEGFPEWCKKNLKELPKIDVSYDGFTYDLGGGNSVIYLEKYDQSTLIHEIFHAVFYLFDAKQMPLTRDSQEAYAYAYQFIFEKLCLTAQDHA